MNLEDLNFEKQISELKRLQTQSFGARETVVNTRWQLADLDSQSGERIAQLDSQLDTELRRRLDQIVSEARSQLEQVEVDVSSQRESSSESRERHLSDLNVRLKEAVAECRQKLQNELWVLQSVCDETNEDTPVSNAERAQEIFQTQTSSLEQLLVDLEARVQATARYLQLCHAGSDSNLPPAVVELKTRDASRVTATEEIDRAMVAAGAIDRMHVPQWTAGWRLYGLGLLIFLVVAIASTVARADVTRFLNPDLAKPDWQWLGASSLIGLGVAVLLVTVLLVLGQSRLRAGFEELLQHTSNARAAADFWAKKSRTELKKLVSSAESWKVDLQTRREQHAAKLQGATDEKVNELIHHHTEQVARQTSLFENQILTGDSESARQKLAIENWKSRELARLQAQHATDVSNGRAEIVHEFARQREQLEAEDSAGIATWQSCLTASHTLAQRCTERAADFPEWADLRERGWKVPTALPNLVPVGRIHAELPAIPKGQAVTDTAESVDLPALLRFPTDTSLVVEHDAAGREPALEFVRAVLLRLLTSITPGRVQFTLIDPVGLGQSFSALMHLADFDELLISSRIWTESIQIRDQLQKVTEHMESVFQTYLRSEFATIEEYNAAAGEVAEPYHFVVVAGFPSSFTEEAARALTSILTNGPRCGVHAIVTWSPEQSIPRSFDLNNLRNCCTQFHVANGLVQPGTRPVQYTVESKNSRLVVDDFLTVAAPAKEAQKEIGTIEFTAAKPPESASYVSLVRTVGEQSRNARRVEVSFSRIAPKPDAVWSLSSADGVDFPIGRAGAARLQFMRLGRGTSQHVLVAGKTGSGKSTLLHILITNLSLFYSPDEIQFYLIDFKKGVEFRTYAANKLPHARVVAIESDREFGLSVLERLDEVLQERGELFRQRGVQDVPSFRRQFPGEKMPRLLLLIDEFQEFFTSEDRVSSKAALLMDRLIRQGRAFGIHVLLGSQTLGGAYSLARSTLGQVAVRIALQCSESDAHLILSEENSAARLLTRPGEAIYNDANGMVEGNHPFQIAWLDEEKREAMIHELTKRPDYLSSSEGRMIVFEGNVAPTVEECESLNGWIRKQSLSASRLTDGLPVWIGEPVSIAQTTSIRFHRSGGQNILIVGQESDLADSILASVISSTCLAGADPEDASCTRLVFLHDDRDQESLERYRNTFSSQIAPRFSLRSAQGTDAAVSELWNEMTLRENGEQYTTAPPILLVVRNIGQFRSLRKDEDDFGMGSFGAPKSITPASQLGDLIRRGPLVGIHTIVWADTFSNAMRWLSNSLLREFDSRIAFRLNQTDSSSLIDTPAAASLSQGRAILYRDQTGSADRFRPFSWPSDSWLNDVSAHGIAASSLNEQSVAVVEKPVVEQPVAEQRDVAQPVVAQPVVAQPVVAQPVVAQPVVAQPVVAQPVVAQPVVEQPVAEQPLDDLPSADMEDFEFLDSSGDVSEPRNVKPGLSDASEVRPTQGPDVSGAVTGVRPTRSGGLSGMAVRISSRGSDTFRLLDAVPPAPAAVNHSAGHSDPSNDFTEMDFDSLMIE